MALLREISRSLRLVLILWILVAVLYPLSALVLGQVLFPYQANGSLLKTAQGQVVGSTLMGQPFSSDRYFWSRPSTVNYSTADPRNDGMKILKTGISGASNLAPTNPNLLSRARIMITQNLADLSPTGDLVYTSGSGLDPHITVESAKAQIARLSKVRNLNPKEIEDLITAHIDRRFLGIFGEPGVNVLQLNLALDGLTS